MTKMTNKNTGFEITPNREKIKAAEGLPLPPPSNILNWNDLTSALVSPDVQHFVSVSGGLPSGFVGYMVAQRFGAERTHFVFADTLGEHDDLYRFLIEISAVSFGLPLASVADLSFAATRMPPLKYGRERARYDAIRWLRRRATERMPRLHWLMDGRDVWQVFNDQKYIGNNRIDPCSKYLKREVIKRFRNGNFDREKTILYFGIDWTEAHRLDGEKGLARRLPEWFICAPFCDLCISKPEIGDLCRSLGVQPSRSYATGAAHDNCHLFCVKSGQAQFRLLLKHAPDVYDFHERKELDWRAKHQKPIAIIRRQKKHVKEYITMRQFREEIEAGTAKIDPFDFGGCGCAIDGDDE